MVTLPRKSLVLSICGLVMGSILLVLMVVSPVLADMGVQPILPGGSNIQPEGETPIQMASEKVVLNVRPATEVDDTVVIRNPEEYGLSGSFDGSPGMYPAVADVLADFTMVNPTNEAVSMAAWFPLASALETEEWNLNPGEVVPRIERFQVILDGKPLAYIVNELPNPNGEDKPPLPWASFPVTFSPDEETHVQISYTVPAWWSYEGLAMNLYYVFQTGAGWAGSIGKAELLVNLPYPASEETIYEMPEGGQIEGHQVRWTWTDLEPGPQDDFFIKLLMLDRWDELQDARAAVAANPRDGEAWLNLASTYIMLTRGKAYSAARMLPGFGEIYQPLGMQAAEEALRLMPDDGRPHYELALLYASALPENASREDLKPVLDELKIVEELLPEYAPNIHDALDFMGAIWVIETARAEASSVVESSTTTPSIPKLTLSPSPTSTLIPSSTSKPLPTTTFISTETISKGSSLIILVATGIFILAIVSYMALKRLQKRNGG
jgi:hypothetical protein